MSTAFPDTCHIWQVDLTSPPGLEHILDAVERERASRLHFERDRSHFIVCHVALRQILGRYLDCNPAVIEFCLGEHGRPSVAGGGSLDFNLSHSGNLALIAVGSAGPLGVDLEAMREISRPLDLARRYLHPHELPLFETAAPERLSALWLTAWTRKEAALKSAGTGLTVRTQLLNTGATEQEKVLDFPPFPPLRVVSFTPAHGYIAALATPLGVHSFEMKRFES